MIPDTPDSSAEGFSHALLDDLIEYVYSGRNCHLLLIGDTAQLPPIKLEVSPALESAVLSGRYGLDVKHIELTKVMRQAQDSGILMNATRLREKLRMDEFDFKFTCDGFDDIFRMMDGHEIMEAIHSSFDNYGFEETGIIFRSNKRANLYNQQIRSRVLFRESELSAGDVLMIVKNNYFWLENKSKAGFIANGDTVEVLEIYKFHELYDFKFADVRLRMVDYPSQEPFDASILLDTLTSHSPSLTYEESGRLYQNIAEDYRHMSSYQQYNEVKNSKFYNALQVKFSHAITCHKSQGGQWESIIVEKPWLPEGPNRDYYRWLYTAITRAKSKVYLIGFTNEDFIDLPKYE
jgi:exodeoxyribonuclease-5